MIENDGVHLQPSVNQGDERFCFYPLGDSAIVMEAGESGSEADWKAMAALADFLGANRERWLMDIVPAYTSVTIVYDPYLLWREQRMTDADHCNASLERDVPYVIARRRLVEIIGQEQEERLDGITRVVDIPVCYGGEYGPDLAEAAAYAGMTEDELCRWHAEAEYKVAMIGFMPGFPYLIGLPETLAQPRKAVPRLRVEAGSVGIAGGQTGVYPFSSPGGWQLIGRTPIKLFDAERSEPSLLRAGDTVRFVQVTEAAWLDEKAGTDRSLSEKNSKGRLQRIVGEGAGDEAGFLVIKPGLHTTVQDLGRTGYRSIGLPAGGAMDSYSLRLANLLVGNEERAAALELSLVGPELVAKGDMLIAVCGAYMGATIGGEELPMWRPVWVRSGTVLRFGSALSGCRAYIAVSGGIGVPEVLGSRSTYTRAALGGLGGRRLAAGDVVPCGAAGAAAASRWAAAWMAALAARPGSWAAAPWFAQPLAYGGGDNDGIELRAMPGSEFGQFSEAARTAFYRERYTVAPDSDRMGCRLNGSPLERTTHAELRSHGVTLGAVQVPSGGAPIVLAADCQTTGGYPKIAHVASVDLPLLAQAKPGDTIRFRHVSLEEAQRLAIARELELRQLAIGIRCRLP